MVRTSRKPLAPWPGRVSEDDLDRAERLLPKARDWPAFEEREPSLSGMLRLALRLGLAELEKRAG